MATTAYGWDSFYSTTLSSAISSSDTTIPVVTPPTAQEGTLVIEGDSSTNREIIYYTSVSGSSVVCPSVGAGRGQEGTTAVAHSSGVSIKKNTTSRDFEVLQDGTALATSAITTTKIADDNVTAAKIADAAVFPANLTTGLSGSSWGYVTWSPTLSGRLNDAKWTKTGRYIQIGKTVHFTLKLVASTTTPMDGGSTDAIFTLPVTASTTYQGGDQTAWIGGAGFYDSGTAVYAGNCYMDSSDATKGRIRFHLASGTNLTIDAITSSTPFTWTTNDEITLSGTYQAA